MCQISCFYDKVNDFSTNPEINALSFEKQEENPKFSRYRHCAKTFTVPNISTHCAQRTVASDLIFAGIIAKCWCNTHSIKTAAENAASQKKTVSNLK